MANDGPFKYYHGAFACFVFAGRIDAFFIFLLDVAQYIRSDAVGFFYRKLRYLDFNSDRQCYAGCVCRIPVFIVGFEKIARLLFFFVILSLAKNEKEG